jgi:murein DD-endopeptidase MepM/ murein hydrolase activator NlpD
LRTKVLRAILFVLPSVALLIIGAVLGAAFIKSPTDLKAENENSRLKDQLIVLEERIQLAEKVVQDLQKRDNNLYRVIFEAEPYIEAEEEKERIWAAGLADLTTDELFDVTTSRVGKLEQLLVHQSRSFDEVKELIGTKKEMLACIPSIQPIDNKDLMYFSSGFGVRMHPIYKMAQYHSGIDLTAQPGTKIYCTGNGTVETADWMGGYGKVVIVDHGFGFKTVYAHCQDIMVHEGQKIPRGQVIATVGSTGFSTGPHLHYEVRRKMLIDGRYVYEPVDPIHYFFNDLTPEEYQKMIEIARHANQMMS